MPSNFFLLVLSLSNSMDLSDNTFGANAQLHPMKQIAFAYNAHNCIVINHQYCADMPIAEQLSDRMNSRVWLHDGDTSGH